MVDTMTALRVGYPSGSLPPYHYQCAAESDFRRTPQCPYPGVDYELIGAVLRTLNRHIQPVVYPITNYLSIAADARDGAVDVLGHLARRDDLDAYNLTASQTLIYDMPSVLMSARPVSDQRDGWGFMRPLHWLVWLVMGALWLSNRLYPPLLVRAGRLLPRPPHPQLIPVSLGIVLMIGLYKSSLLAKLLTNHHHYVVDSLDDFATLPNSVRIYDFDGTWTLMVAHTEQPLRRALAAKPSTKVNEFNASILREVQAKQAVFVGLESMNAQLVNKCPLTLRRIELGHAVNYMMGFGPHMAQLVVGHADQGIIELRAMTDRVVARYQRYYRRGASKECGTEHEDEDDDDDHSGRMHDYAIHLSALYGLLAIFGSGAALALLVCVIEWLSAVELRPTRHKQIVEQTKSNAIPGFDTGRYAVW